MDDDEGAAEEKNYDNEEEGEGEEEEPLYPGLYRALYAFDPEGTAEMALAEDQVVRVVGRGGGVRWGAVVDERGREWGDAGRQGRSAWVLVQESYLEAVRLDVLDE